MTSIKGTVTRLAGGSNFFFRVTDPDEATQRHLNLDGHRVGTDEISAEKLNASTPKLRRYEGELPKIGDAVELVLVTPYEA
jgi:hypothetical protein